MKKTILSLAAGLLGVFASQAQPVDIYITGATAFRADAYNAIRNMYGANLTGQNPVHPASGQNKVTFQGTIPGLFGARVVTIRTSYSGSAAGVGALVGNTILQYNMNIANAVQTNHTADFAFSDAFQLSTDFPGPPALVDTTVAVQPFVFVRGNTASVKITDMTAQDARALTGIGWLPLFKLSGDAADLASADIVNFVGRDNGSGTRVVTLSEVGLGAPPFIAQRKASGGNFVDDPVGWASGGNVATNINNTSASGEGPGGAIGYMGIADANTAVAGGGVFLPYDGVPYSAAAVRTGKYTLWGYEHLYHRPDLTDADKVTTFKPAFATQINTEIVASATAIQVGTMSVSRGADGAVVTP